MNLDKGWFELKEKLLLLVLNKESRNNTKRDNNLDNSNVRFTGEPGKPPKMEQQLK